jgi:hypothetical protein
VLPGIDQQASSSYESELYKTYSPFTLTRDIAPRKKNASALIYYDIGQKTEKISNAGRCYEQNRTTL